MVSAKKREALRAALVIRTVVVAAWFSASLRAADQPASHIYKSTDQGRSWSQSDSGLPTQGRVNALTAFGKAILAGTDSGIFVSHDSGQKWTAIPGTTRDLGKVTSFASFGRTLYAGTHQSGVFASTDEGKTWKALNNGLGDRNVRSLLSWRETLYAGTDTQGVFRSQDGGRTWIRFNQGIPSEAQVFALEAVGNRIFAGLYRNGLYRWDGQQSWVKVGRILPLVLASIGDTLVAGQNSGGIHWSTDSGETWNAGLADQARTPRGSPGLPPDAPVWSAAGGNGQVFAGAFDGIYYSNDKGRTWSRAEAGLPAASPGISFLVTDQFVLAASLIETAEVP